MISIQNIGDPDSVLHWEIELFTDWGTWMFSEKQGTITPEEGNKKIHISVTAPDKTQETFSGYLKIVNKENASDFEIIPIVLSTPYIHFWSQLIFNHCIQQYPLLYPFFLYVYSILT